MNNFTFINNIKQRSEIWAVYTFVMFLTRQVGMLDSANIVAYLLIYLTTLSQLHKLYTV
jgi:hypothetical protein